MNENHIRVTTELCTEDRARLDKLIELLTVRAEQAKVDHERKYDAKPEPDKAPTEKKAGTVEAPKIAQDAPKASEHPTLDPFPETPAVAKERSEAPEKPVTTAELQQLVIALCRANKKDAVREVITSYGVANVAGLSADKYGEVYKSLKALEG